MRLDEIEPFAEEGEGQGTLVPPAERDERFAGFLGFRDARRVEYVFDEKLAAAGVIFTDLATAVREHPDLVREYFMTRCVPPEDSKFAALHGAFWDNGVFLYVPRGVAVEHPLRAVISAGLKGTSSLSHTLIVLEEGSHAVYAEDYISADAKEQGVSSRIVEIILKRDANLHYVGTQRWGRSVYDFHTERALLGQDTVLNLQTIELGSRLSKGRVESVLEGDGVNVKLLGLYIEDGNQHLDRYTLQDHIGQAGVSDLLFKGVLTGKARSVFSGLIRVRPQARRPPPTSRTATCCSAARRAPTRFRTWRSRRATFWAARTARRSARWTRNNSST